MLGWVGGILLQIKKKKRDRDSRQVGRLRINKLNSCMCRVRSWGLGWKLPGLCYRSAAVGGRRHWGYGKKLVECILHINRSFCVMIYTYICKNLSRPSRRCSITSSAKRLVNTLPGKGGILTRVDSRSSTSRNHSKSLYRLRTDDCFSLNAGILVYRK